MPKKTKKQKILAQLHRKFQFESTVQYPNLDSKSQFVKNQNNISASNQSLTYTASLNSINKAVIKAKTIKSDSSYAYVYNDLIRITIFTIFALLLQGVLYFLLRTR